MTATSQKKLIVDLMTDENDDINEEVEDPDDNQIERNFEERMVCKTSSEALEFIRSLRSFCEFRELNAGFPLLCCLEDIVMKRTSSVKGTKMTDFLNQ